MPPERLLWNNTFLVPGVLCANVSEYRRELS